MSDGSGQWHDLRLRIVSAIGLVAIAGGAIWAGGWFFTALIVAAGAAIVWEAARMMRAINPVAAGLVAALALVIAVILPPIYAVPAVLAAALVNMGMAKDNKPLYLAAQVVALLGALSFQSIFTHSGLIWLLWLVCVVIASDLGGYFAGRAFGGPKFWPAISPKKTWSGTVAGWGLAGLVGLAFMGSLGAGAGIILMSAVLAFAAQMGDIFESWVKRRAGIKDSSNLIPGHGGVWDRFDGMLGAGLGFSMLQAVPGLAVAAV